MAVIAYQVLTILWTLVGVLALSVFIYGHWWLWTLARADDDQSKAGVSGKLVINHTTEMKNNAITPQYS